MNRTRGDNPQILVDTWNKAHSIGTPVMVSKDSHEVVRGLTTSEAYVLGGHTAVIHIDTIRGCYSLTRVTADKSAPKEPGGGLT